MPRPKPFKLTPPKPYIPKEYDEQVKVFEWLATCKLSGADMFYATLNGVRLPIGLAVKMKRAGLLSGPPDINGDVARRGYHGIRLELKRAKGGRVSLVQDAWIARLIEEGFFAVAVFGARETIEQITWYLGDDE